MGWERRERGGLYYTRSRKVNGRVVREYFGAGEVAQAVAVLDTQDRLQRSEQAEAIRAEHARIEELERAVVELCDIADLAATGTLLLAGYRKHHRGEWRRKRETTSASEG